MDKTAEHRGLGETMLEGASSLLKKATPAVGIGIAAGREIAQSTPLREVAAHAREDLAEGVRKTREMIDTVRGAIPPSVRSAMGKAAEAASPAIGVLRRGASLLEHPEQTRGRDGEIQGH